MSGGKQESNFIKSKIMIKPGFVLIILMMPKLASKFKLKCN